MTIQESWEKHEAELIKKGVSSYLDLELLRAVYFSGVIAAIKELLPSRSEEQVKLMGAMLFASAPDED